MNTRPPSQTLNECQQIDARIDVLATEIAWLTAALDTQFKRTTDTRARRVLFPVPTRSLEWAAFGHEPQGRALRPAAAVNAGNALR
jgi:hypothetical protein